MEYPQLNISNPRSKVKVEFGNSFTPIFYIFVLFIGMYVEKYEQVYEKVIEYLL